MSWGVCPTRPEPPVTCSLNYELIGNLCLRFSTIPLSWLDAEKKCKAEGGHLLTMDSLAVQKSTKDTIKNRVAKKEKTFFPPYGDDVENWWIGGTVRQVNDWRWIGTLGNFSSFTFWTSGKCLKKSRIGINSKTICFFFFFRY